MSQPAIGSRDKDDMPPKVLQDMINTHRTKVEKDFMYNRLKRLFVTDNTKKPTDYRASDFFPPLRK